MFFIEDYSPTESAFIYKTHHAVADGIAIVLMYLNLSDDPQLDNVPSVTARISFFNKLIIHLMMPFYLVWGMLKAVILLPTQNNSIRNAQLSKEFKGNKNACISKDIPV